MNPFARKKQLLSALKDIKDDNNPVTCKGCGEKYGERELRENMYVCPVCGRHYRVSAPYRIKTTVDKGTFKEICRSITSGDPLDFLGYGEKLSEARKKTGLREAVICGTGRIDGIKAVFCFMDSRFFMGSMGSAVGEKITRCFEYAARKKLPVVVFATSGGARMQEGLLSLMQMAKTSGAVKRHSDERLLYISVLTDPTTGGVSASYAMEGDVILAEPGATIGFAGKRVVEAMTKEKTDRSFQTSRFVFEHGFVDSIVERSDERRILYELLSFHTGR